MADEPEHGTAELLRKAGQDRDVDFLREGVRVLSQALMEVEVSAAPGRRAARAHAGADAGSATATASGSGTRGWGRSSCGCRACGTAATSRACWSRASGPSGRWWRWCRRPTCRGSRRGGSTTWCRRWGWTGSSKSQVSRAVRGAGRGGRALPRTGRSTGAYPYVWLDATFVKVRQDGRVVSMAVVIADRGARRAASARCWGWTSGRARTGRSGCSSCAAWSRGGSAGCSW